MELTPEEEAVILRMRQDEQQKLENKKTKLALLRAAYEFEKWNQENGMFPSYSNYINNICHEEGNGYVEAEMYNSICKILKAAE